MSMEILKRGASLGQKGETARVAGSSRRKKGSLPARHTPGNPRKGLDEKRSIIDLIIKTGALMPPYTFTLKV